MIKQLSDLKMLFNYLGVDYPTEPVNHARFETLRLALKRMSFNENDLLASFTTNHHAQLADAKVDSAQALFAITNQMRELLALALKLGIANSLSTSLHDLHQTEMSRFWTMEQITAMAVEKFKRREVKPNLYVVWDHLGQVKNPPTFIPFTSKTCDDILFMASPDEEDQDYQE